jgi:hypothetical protein
MDGWIVPKSDNTKAVKVKKARYMPLHPPRMRYPNDKYVCICIPKRKKK